MIHEEHSLKQGRLQSLFYQAHNNLAVEDQESDMEIMCLLDGWITEQIFLFECMTAYSTNPGIFTVLVTQRHRFDTLESTLTHDAYINTFTTEDLVVVHGLPDSIPFPILSTNGIDNGGYLELRLITKVKVEAGHDIDLLWRHDTLGTTNTTGDFDVLAELKHIISPVRWN